MNTYPQFSSGEDLVLSGVRKLKVAALMIVTSILLGSAPLLAVLGSLFTFNVDVVVSVILAYIALVFVALVSLLAAVYAFLLPSSRTMAVWRPEEFSTVYSLLLAGYAGGLVSTVIALIMLVLDAIGVTSGDPIVVLPVVLLLVIGIVLFIVGWIGNIAYFLKLRDVFNSSVFLVAGILLIIPLLSIISWILTYIEASSIEKKILIGQIKL
jgi:hypothetical protein